MSEEHKNLSGYIMQVAEYKYCALALRYESSYDLLSDNVCVV